MKPKVVIIILNWNNWSDTVECLESVYQINYPNYDIIIIDNGSTDNSTEKIIKYCKGGIKVKSRFFSNGPNNKPIDILMYTKDIAEKGGILEKETYFSNLPSNTKLRLILNGKNYGFAEGNNVGIRYALKALNPDYVLLLNNDTVVDKNFLTELIKVAETDSKIGIVGPKMYYYDHPKMFWGAGGKVVMLLEHWQRGMNKIDKGQFEKIEDVDFIAGAGLLIKKEVFEKIGLIPTDYFLGWEDIDFCMAAKKHGFRVNYVPKSIIWHKVSASYKKGNLNYKQVVWGIRNRILFRHKFLSYPEFIIYLLILIFLLSPLYCLVYLGYYRDPKRFKCYLEGLFEGLMATIIKRK
jgi:GT2 family glycosyltransferase